jgi:hypothetical protein
VCNLLRYEAEEIGCELVDARFRPYGSQRGVLPFNVRLVCERAGQLGKQLLGLLGEDMFYERLDVYIV